MSACEFQSRLDAYHDGELDAQTAERLEAHLPTCDACRGELAQLGEMSHLFGGGVFGGKNETPMLPLELARLHQHIDTTSAAQVQRIDFLRTAGMLTALAASVMIISGVWLAEFPSRHTPGLSPGSGVVPASEVATLPANLPDWERTALTLSIEPSPMDQLPQGQGHQDEGQMPPTGLADARFSAQSIGDAQIADWMLTGLNSGVNHANP